MMTAEDRVEAALHSADPVRALRVLVQNLAFEGSTKTEISGLLEKFLLPLRKPPDVRTGTGEPGTARLPHTS